MPRYNPSLPMPGDIRYMRFGPTYNYREQMWYCEYGAKSYSSGRGWWKNTGRVVEFKGCKYRLIYFKNGTLIGKFYRPVKTIDDIRRTT